MDLSREGDVRILRMEKPGNTLEPEFLRELHARLDEVEEGANGPAALVITGGGKFFSNGLDLDIVAKLEGEEQREFGKLILGLMRRLLTSKVPVVAALNGHAFAGGAFFALACDYRFMREDRGWFCISEIDVGIPIGRPLMSIAETKLTPQVLRTAVLTGHRYTGPEALEGGIADGIASEADLLPAAIAQAAVLAAKERGIFASCKETLFAAPVAEIDKVIG
jgi:enoyl-CoA hydratase/carnithine racemase